MTDLEKLIKACEGFDYGTMLSGIADAMFYSAEAGGIVIPVPDVADEVFPDDPALRSGALTFATWRMALHILADRLPPWDQTQDEKYLRKRAAALGPTDDDAIADMLRTKTR